MGELVGIMPYSYDEIVKSPAHSYLAKLASNAAIPLSSKSAVITEEGLTREMMKRWEGNYRVEEYYNPIIHNFAYRLVFDDPHEEVVFRLRHE